MVIHDAKTKFMVVNSDAGDKMPLELVYAGQTYMVEWCDSIYLSSIFTADGRIQNAVKAHAQVKHKHCLKFVSFVGKNKDFPFPVKRKVSLSALMSSILYTSESWVTENLSTVNPLYRMSIKDLLGVRQTTANDISLLEIRLPPLKHWVKQKQLNFFF